MHNIDESEITNMGGGMGYINCDCINNMSGDAETNFLSYIGNTSGQQLSVVLDMSNTDTYKIDYCFNLSSSSATRRLMGFGANGGKYWGLNAANKIDLSNSAVGANAVSPDTWYNAIVEYGNGKIKMTIKNNDFSDSATRNDVTPLSNQETFKLFGIESNFELTNTKINHCRIYKNDVLILDLRPYLDDENVPCMLDTVSNTKYYNVGTGTFIYG